MFLVIKGMAELDNFLPHRNTLYLVTIGVSMTENMPPCTNISGNQPSISTLLVLQCISVLQSLSRCAVINCGFEVLHKLLHMHIL